MSSQSLTLQLDGDGFLKCDVSMSLAELGASPFVTGAGMGVSGWNRDLRRQLVANMAHVIGRMRKVGFVGEILVDGSFASSRRRPRDIDVCYIVEQSDVPQYEARIDQLNELEGCPLWAFDEDELVKVRGVDSLVSPLWERYRVDLRFDFGLFCGIYGPDGRPLTYREAFRQQSVSCFPKGLIKLID